jgi:hypothetical protein
MIKIYTITEHAEKQWRLGVRQGKYISYPVLARKISSLIYASRDRYYYSEDEATVAFGTCIITFSLDKVIDIHWSRENHRCRVSEIEEKLLRDAYAYFGLDFRGMKFIETKEVSYSKASICRIS